MVDVVSQPNAAQCFDEDDAKGLIGGCGGDASEPNRQYNGGCPIICPNELFPPSKVNQIFLHQPVSSRIKLHHQKEDYGQDIGEQEVYK